MRGAQASRKPRAKEEASGTGLRV